MAFPAPYRSSTFGTRGNTSGISRPKLFPSDDKQRKSWAEKLIKKLNRGGVETVVADLRAFPTRKPELRDLFRTEVDYFERNRERMRYHKYRKQGLFIDSGVIEARMQDGDWIAARGVRHVLDITADDRFPGFLKRTVFNLFQ